MSSPFRLGHQADELVSNHAATFCVVSFPGACMHLNSDLGKRLQEKLNERYGTNRAGTRNYKKI